MKTKETELEKHKHFGAPLFKAAAKIENQHEFAPRRAKRHP